MFASIKSFFVGILISIGIISAPATPTNFNDAPLPRDEVVIQEVTPDTQPSANTAPEAPKSPQNETKSPISTESASIFKTAIIEPVATQSVIGEDINDASVALEVVNGRCGNANDDRVSNKPTDRLCLSGESTQVTEIDGKYVWQCLGSNGGDDSYQCKAYLTIDGQCGPLANTIVSENYSKDQLCSVGDYNNLSTASDQLHWTCNGVYGGKDVSCYAAKVAVTQSAISTPRIDGVCGSAVNSTHITIPTTNLCMSGNISSKNLNGTIYSWSCVGSNGGESNQCSTTIQQEECAPTQVFIMGRGMVTTTCP